MTNYNEDKNNINNDATLPVALQSLKHFDNLVNAANNNYELRQPFTFSSEVIAQKINANIQ